MKKTIILIVLAFLFLAIGLVAKKRFYDPKYKLENATATVNAFLKNGKLKNGDLIFQASLSNQSKAIQLATKSEYSHCGLIFNEGNKLYVFEAIQPVRLTPLEDWIARGKEGKYVVKRLKNHELLSNPEVYSKMTAVCKEFQGKDYDLGFDWSDDKIYCSELIWKVYQRGAGVEIGKLQKLKDFDLSNPAVKKKLKERYGNSIPMDEIVISPASIFESEKLMTVDI